MWMNKIVKNLAEIRVRNGEVLAQGIDMGLNGLREAEEEEDNHIECELAKAKYYSLFTKSVCRQLSNVYYIKYR